MANFTTRFDAKARYILGVAFLLLLAVICVSFNFNGKEEFELAKQQILLRKIGHELLLYSGDSTSRVMPVKETGANEYRIQFENEISFETDSLVSIIRRSLQDDPLSDEYIVNVRNCTGKDVLFGYAISGNKRNNIIPCSGRKQPRGCYTVGITFRNQGMTFARKGYLIGGLSLFAFVGLLVVRPLRIRKRKKETDQIEKDGFQIGNTLFDPNTRQIIFSGVITELTPKENKLLRIFAVSQNSIIERTRIQKEIWEDEGVIVGRSLDVFISKLRKKLENDQSIQLVNVHGKGYRLKVEGSSVPGLDGE